MEIFNYTGDNTQQEGIEQKNILITPGATKWVKKKADKNCHSKDPNHCLVWCLQEIHAVEESYFVVMDTFKIKDFKEVNISTKTLAEYGGFAELREVLCQSSSYYRQALVDVQFSLKELGYAVKHIDQNSDALSKNSKAELIKFQKANALPLGQLDIETLDALGVGY